jgi:hypothetical protein
MDGRTQAKTDRLLFAALCVAEVFPGAKADRETKATIFDKAARWGYRRTDCPSTLGTRDRLHIYIKNHWKKIRSMLPTEHNILPCYINGPTWGGGGYRKGNIVLARKQIERDKKIVDGVLSAANDYATATIALFPKVDAQHRHTVTRRIGTD